MNVAERPQRVKDQLEELFRLIPRNPGQETERADPKTKREPQPGLLGPDDDVAVADAVRHRPHAS